MSDVPSLVVSEVFGPTVSGEGRSLGQRCAFVRLMGCNLHCSWCDTAYTWDASRFDLHTEGTRLTWAEIADRVIAMNVELVVISGGEPLLHQNQRAWHLLMSTFAGAGIRVEVETNGTILPSAVSARGVHRFTVSPKLAHAGDEESARIVPEVLQWHSVQGSDFKFVCASPEHVAEVEKLAEELRLPRRQIWVMPLGDTHYDVADRLGMITDTAVAAGFNVTTRLHIQVWGNARGH